MGDPRRFRSLAIADQTVVCFLAVNFGYFIVEPDVGKCRLSMSEIEMNLVNAVFKLAEERIGTTAFAGFQ